MVIAKIRKGLSDTIDNWISTSAYYYLFLLLAFIMPVYQKAVPWVVILIVAKWMAEGQFRRKYLQIISSRRSQLIASFALLFLLYLLSLLYTGNQRQGYSELQIGLSMLVFPVIFATLDMKAFPGEKTNHVFVAFVAGCLAASLILIISAVVRYHGSSNLNEFIYTKIAAGGHPSYISMYFSLSFALIALYLFEAWKSSSSLKKTLLFLLLTWLSFMILLLCSKAGIITHLVVFLVMILFLFQKGKSPVPGIILGMLAVSFTISAFYLFPPTMSRFGKAIGTLYNFDNIESTNTESTAERLLIWDSALEAGFQHPVMGYGIGDVKEALGKVYQVHQMRQALKLSLNAHNQYLQTYLAVGIPGILLLLGYMIGPFFLAVKKKYIIYAVFIVVIGLNFLFESMLCRQAGVVFYAFFNTFFLFIRSET
jgi:O-antigen ligase